MSRNQRMRKEVNEETRAVNFIFASGDVATVNLADLPENIQVRLALHGLSQKGGDAGALGKDASDADIESAVRDQIDRLINGEWATRKAGEPRVTMIVKALARIKGIEESEARERYATLDDDTKKALRQNPEVTKVMAQIRVEMEEAKDTTAPETAAAALEAF